MSKHSKRGRAKFLSLGLKWMLYSYVLNCYDFLFFEKKLNIFSFQTQKIIMCILLSIAM
jgi:hypothetical protein